MINIGQDEVVITTPEQSVRTGQVALQEDGNLSARSETIIKIHLYEEINSNQFYLLQPSES